MLQDAARCFSSLHDAALALGLLLEGDVLDLRLVPARHRAARNVHAARRLGALGAALRGSRAVLPVGAVLVRRARHGGLRNKQRQAVSSTMSRGIEGALRSERLLVFLSPFPLVRHRRHHGSPRAQEETSKLLGQSKNHIWGHELTLTPHFIPGVHFSGGL